ncbi:hypothetical protein Ae201684P_017982 [Aphanomyces euteiches]|nr:hypothetical protein Ae201684P_017982 [Aphanomyces euteiches]
MDKVKISLERYVHIFGKGKIELFVKFTLGLAIGNEFGEWFLLALSGNDGFVDGVFGRIACWNPHWREILKRLWKSIRKTSVFKTNAQG